MFDQRRGNTIVEWLFWKNNIVWRASLGWNFRILKLRIDNVDNNPFWYMLFYLEPAKLFVYKPKCIFFSFPYFAKSNQERWWQLFLIMEFFSSLICKLVLPCLKLLYIYCTLLNTCLCKWSSVLGGRCSIQIV